MLKKKKNRTKAKPAARVPARQGIKIIEPERALAREIAEEDRDLRRAKVTEILGGFRQDREKRKEELRRFMENLRRQKVERMEAIRKYMRNLRERVLGKKRMLPEVKV